MLFRSFDNIASTYTAQNDCLCIIGFEPEMNNLNSVQMFGDQFRYHFVFSWVLFQAGNFLNSSAVNFLEKNQYDLLAS